MQVEKRKGLIQECDADRGAGHSGQAMSWQRKRKKKKKKSEEKAVRRGLLEFSKGERKWARAEPVRTKTDSRREGLEDHSWTNAKWWTRSMDPDVQVPMAEYAATGTTSAPASISTSGGRADAARRAGKKPPQDAVRQAKPAEKKQVKRPNPVEEADFDRLMELIDPDSAKSNVNDDNSGLDNALGLGKEDMGMLQSMLFGQGMEGLGGASKSKSTRPSPAAPASKTMPGLKGQLNLPTLKYDIATDGVQDKKGNPAIRCTIFCPGCSNFAELALDMSDRTIKLRAPGAQPLTVRLPCKVDAARCS